MSLRDSIANWFDRWATRTLAEESACRIYARDVRYRIFEKRDEAACAAIYRALEGGFPAGGFECFRESLLREEQSAIVAERAGRVVGMGGISLSGEGTAALWYGLVDPAHQGLGIGTALALLRLCSLPHDDCSVFIYTLSKPRTFYQRLGFQTCFEWQDEHGEFHPGAVLELPGFRRDFVLAALRKRGVVLEGELVPRLAGANLIDRVRLPDGTIEFRHRGEEDSPGE